MAFVTFDKLGSHGRLGNQFWQISATIGYAFRYNCDYIFPKWEYENYFNIPKDKFINGTKYNQTYEEPHFHYAGIPYIKDVNLHGYFQSYKYWQDHADSIKTLLMPKCSRKKINATAIHVRRTDYLVHTGCYKILNMKNYYEKAMRTLNSKKFLIFSDDINWCKSNFVGNQFEFSEGHSGIDDLSTMIACSNHIIANSSFSWWGAWLSHGEKVIAPKGWFGPKLAPTHNTKDLYPDKWVKI